MYIAILGRQPALGMAELEHLYGAENTRWFSDISATVASDSFSIDHLGGAQKTGRVVIDLPRSDWRQVSMKIVQAYAQAWTGFDGKITLGISVYGFDVPVRDIQKTGIVLKQKLKKADVSLRLIPQTEPALNSAASHHNKLGLSNNKVELLIVRARNGRVIVAESIGAQNITAYTKRDQERPKRDAFVGMLPPKLAQMMINLATTASSSPSPLSPSQSHSTGGGASPWRSARPEGDISSNERAETVRQTRSVATQASSDTTTAIRNNLQPELEATSGPDFKPGAKPVEDSSGGGGGGDELIKRQHEQTNNRSLRILDPFCGTGVVLQEAALMGYAVYGTDLVDKMIDYTRTNLQWLADTHRVDVDATLEQGDAMDTHWQQPVDVVVCESYLGQPFSAPPSPAKLDQVRKNCNHIITTFLENIGKQVTPGTPLCIAIPAWRDSNGQFVHLPLTAQLAALGYSRYEFKHIKNDELLYYREDQIVARELLVLVKS